MNRAEITDLTRRIRAYVPGADQALYADVSRALGFHVPARPLAGWHGPDGQHVGLAPNIMGSVTDGLDYLARYLPHWRLDTLAEGRSATGSPEVWVACLSTREDGEHPCQIQHWIQSSPFTTPAAALTCGILWAVYKTGTRP